MIQPRSKLQEEEKWEVPSWGAVAHAKQYWACFDFAFFKRKKKNYISNKRTLETESEGWLVKKF